MHTFDIIIHDVMISFKAKILNIHVYIYLWKCKCYKIFYIYPPLKIYDILSKKIMNKISFVVIFVNYTWPYWRTF